MTDLVRKVSRRTRHAYPVLYRRPERIIVSLDAGDILTFRAERRRAVWALPIDTAFRYAVRLQAFQQAAEKHRARAARKTKA